MDDRLKGVWAPPVLAIPSSIAARLDRAPLFYLGLLLLVLLGAAWLLRFIQDDAFISFRYSYNLVEGWGLQFNPPGFDPKPVEGYTNFLWTMIIAAPIALGYDVIMASQLLGLVCFFFALLGTYRLATALLGTRSEALIAVFVAGTNFTFISYATGGLETMLVTALLVWCFRVAVSLKTPDDWTVPRLFILSVLAGLAVLTRMDAGVFLLVIAGLLGLKWLVLDKSIGAKLGLAFVAAVPAVALIGGWLVWKIGYYGDIFPNTYYVKLSDQADPVQTYLRGIFFVGKFAISYLVLPFLVILIVRFFKIVKDLNWLALVGILAIWSVYIIQTGGDFMEFRFMVAAIPLLSIMMVAGLRHLGNFRFLMLIAIVGASAFHGGTFQRTGGIEAIRELHGHVMSPPENWKKIGEAYNRYFADLEPTPVLALGAAGAMPYYSRLPVIDMLGLTDEWVAKNGEVYSSRPGHQRAGNHAYMIERGVNLYTGQINGVRRQADISRHCDIPPYDIYFQLLSPMEDKLPDQFSFIIMPIDEDWVYQVLYMRPTPEIDAAIAKHGLQLCRVNVSHKKGLSEDSPSVPIPADAG